MIVHLRNLDESSLASKIYKEQLEKGWPGLAREGKEICEELEIENVNETRMGKNDFKRLVINAIKINHEKMLREQAQEKTKCLYIMKDGYGKKRLHEHGRHRKSETNIQKSGWSPTFCWKLLE